MLSIFDDSKQYLKRIKPAVDEIMRLSSSYTSLPDEEFKRRTEALKEKIRNGESNEEVLVEAYALVREASRRVLGKSHYACQIESGIAMVDNKIAEMATGEGKTLSAVLPAYLKALEGKGVHIITSNDYLAERDYNEMSELFSFLGISTGLIQSSTVHDDRKKAYAADITYCSSSQVCFDYLRDNLVYDKKNTVQRGFGYALVDEADSILIDEAETPVIISKKQEKATKKYFDADVFVNTLRGISIPNEDTFKDEYESDFDYVVDKKTNTVRMTDRLYQKMEARYDLDKYDELGRNMTFYIQNALNANFTRKKDTDYIVELDKNGLHIEIVDPNTGRVLKGRKYGDGLHQAIQAKEIYRLMEKYRDKVSQMVAEHRSKEEIDKVMEEAKTYTKVDDETYSLSSITFRNYLKMYESIGGMSGTAYSIKDEFKQTYGLDVLQVPRNKEKKAVEGPEKIYGTKKEKYEAIVKQILESHKKGQPILIGTSSIKESLIIAKYLDYFKLDYSLLNANPENSKKEGAIISGAGHFGAITISTNMAGRGTDIKVDEEAKKVGGLMVIGTERNISKRIDDQLKGRTGRQGDPGTILFYSSLEDDMLKSFFDDSTRKALSTNLEGAFVTRTLDKVQKRREGLSYTRRKCTNQYDDVVDTFRKIYYTDRSKLLEDELLHNNLSSIITKAVDGLTESAIDEQTNKFDITKLDKRLYEGVIDPKDLVGASTQKATEYVSSMIIQRLNAILSTLPFEVEKKLRNRFLSNADTEWANLCNQIDESRKGIGLSSFLTGEDPVEQYRSEIEPRFSEFVTYSSSFLVDDLIYLEELAKKKKVVITNNK